jgi:hypothetical protein
MIPYGYLGCNHHTAVFIKQYRRTVFAVPPNGCSRFRRMSVHGSAVLHSRFRRTSTHGSAVLAYTVPPNCKNASAVLLHTLPPYCEGTEKTLINMRLQKMISTQMTQIRQIFADKNTSCRDAMLRVFFGDKEKETNPVRHCGSSAQMTQITQIFADKKKICGHLSNLRHLSAFVLLGLPACCLLPVHLFTKLK